MLSFQKRIVSLLPIFYFCLVSLSVFLDFELILPEQNVEAVESGQIMEPILVRTPGVLHRIGALQAFILELESQKLPPDTEPEESLDRMRRILIGQELLLGVQVFFAFFALSAFVAFLNRAWFSFYLQRVLYILGLPFGIQQGFTFIKLGIDGAIWAFFVAAFVFTLTFLGIAAFFWIRKFKNDLDAFLLLKHSASLDEEGRPQEPSTRNSYLKIFSHFSMILVFGILFGNLIYIPLFSLQKHYSKEFGILLGFLLVLLSGFYVFNYSKYSGQPPESKIKTYLVSFAYLQYRFLRNAFTMLFVTCVLSISVIVLFRILTWNTEFLQKEARILEESTDL
jgi:hypothetical protein